MRLTNIKNNKKQKVIRFLAFFTIIILISAIFTEIGVKSAIKTTQNYGEFVVVLDAGHGGIDGGVVGRTTGVKECDLNLKFVKLLEKKLEKAGVKVVLTRKSDSALYSQTTKGFKKEDFKRRKEIIIANNPDAVISVHMNYIVGSPNRRGTQVFYDNKNENSYPLAEVLQNKMNTTMNEKYGHRTYSAVAGSFYIVNCTKFPSVIVECGFLSNETDEKLLQDEEYQEEFCYHLFSGIMTYLHTKSTDV